MFIKREEKRMEMFKFELMPEPAAFFKDGCMRRPSKSILQNKILDVNFVMTAALLIEVHSFALNVWPHGSTYSDIASQYLKYLNDRYGSIASEIVVVVDGDVGYSTKAEEHAHRNQGVTM